MDWRQGLEVFTDLWNAPAFMVYRCTTNTHAADDDNNNRSNNDDELRFRARLNCPNWISDYAV